MSQKPSKPESSNAKSPDGDRIAKVLSRAGVASRREAEKMIGEGRISVNDKVITSPALNVTAKDKIAVDGRPLDAPEPARLWLFHKPTGLVTTHKDEQGRPTIYDDLPEDMPRVMSVGRLDLNSEGLLLLTNDGGLKRQLELPSTGWLRRYRVRVKGNPTDSDLAPLRDGIVVDRETFQPMQVTLDRQQGANAWLTVGLREGKNREIRRAMENIGLSVNRLIRVSYGPFQLGPLKPGEVEEVRRRVLRDQLGMEPEDEADTPKRPRAVRAGRTDRRFNAPGKPGKPGSRAGEKPGGKGDARFDSKPGAKSGAKSGPKSGGKPGSKPGGKPVKGKDQAKDAPWETSQRPRLTRRRPKKN